MLESFNLIILLITLFVSFSVLFLKNNSANALNYFIFSIITRYPLLLLFLSIILFVVIFNVKTK